MSYAGVARNSREREEALKIAAASFGSVISNHDAAILRKAFLVQEHPGYSTESAIVVCSAEGSVIASAFLIDCALPMSGQMLQGVFISSISVAESSRGKGISLLLMNAAINAATNRGADIAMLIARRAVDGYYNRFGFWGVSQYSKVTFSMATLPMKASSVKQVAARPVTELDFNTCAVLHAQSYEGLLGHCLRQSEMWLYIMRKLPYLGMRMDLVTVGDQIVGYAIHDGQGNFHEVATGAESPGCGAFTFLAVCAPQCEYLTLHLPPIHPFLRGLHGADVSLTLRECPYGGHMVRILNKSMVNGVQEQDSFFDFAQTIRAMEMSSVTNFDSVSVTTMRRSFNIPLLDQI